MSPGDHEHSCGASLCSALCLPYITMDDDGRRAVPPDRARWDRSRSHRVRPTDAFHSRRDTDSV